jgi:hypothetical protein
MLNERIPDNVPKHPASEFYMPMFQNTLSVPSSEADRYDSSYLSTYEDGKDRVF